MRKEELRTYIENHESEMIEDLKSLIRIPSEKQAAEPGKPFGAPAAEALAQGIEILEKYGFAVAKVADGESFGPVRGDSPRWIITAVKQYTQEEKANGTES